MKTFCIRHVLAGAIFPSGHTQINYVLFVVFLEIIIILSINCIFVSGTLNAIVIGAMRFIQVFTGLHPDFFIRKNCQLDAIIVKSLMVETTEEFNSIIASRFDYLPPYCLLPWDVVFKAKLLWIGNTSLCVSTNMFEGSLTSTKASCLGTFTFVYVQVDKTTFQKMPISQTILNNHPELVQKSKQAITKPVDSSKFNTKPFTYYRLVTYQDIDFGEHADFYRVIQFVFESLRKAVTEGHNIITKGQDIRNMLLKKVTIVFDREMKVDDVLKIETWQDSEENYNYGSYTQLKVGTTLVATANMESGYRAAYSNL